MSLPNSFDVSFDSEAEKIRIEDNFHTDSPTPVGGLAGVEGIEPSSKVLETLVLPLNHTPV